MSAWTRMWAVLSLAASLAAWAAPAAAQYPPAEEDLVASATVVEPGGGVTISGRGFCPNTPVTITVEPVAGGTSLTLDTFSTDGEGTFSRTVTVPADLTPGQYALKATGTDRDCVSPRVLGVVITVEEEERPFPVEPPILVWWLFAVLVMAVSGLLFGAWRRRRRRLRRGKAEPELVSTGAGPPPTID